jgi:Ca2+-binding EF-hand superfamily protein
MEAARVLDGSSCEIHEENGLDAVAVPEKECDYLEDEVVIAPAAHDSTFSGAQTRLSDPLECQCDGGDPGVTGESFDAPLALELNKCEPCELTSGSGKTEAADIDGDDFLEADDATIRRAFKRFQVPDGNEVHRDDLSDLIQYLGYTITVAGDVANCADAVTHYSEFDLDDVRSFVSLYAKEEATRIRTSFHAHDSDQTGQIKSQAVRKTMCDIGMVPVRAMVDEAFKIADLDSDGELCFFEFVRFLSAYGREECFTGTEVAKLRRVFERFATGVSDGEPVMQPSALVEALVQVFGLETRQLSVGVSNRLSSKGRLQVVGFREFLKFARRLREAECARYHNVFNTHDTDGSGRISTQEILQVLRALGYEPLGAVITEVLEEVDFESDGQLDYEEFLHFIMIFRARDGFLQREVKELEAVFARFDFDNSGEFSVAELGAVLRYLGHAVVLDELHTLVSVVDVNRSGALDLPEFMRLMRLHRDSEIRRFRDIFDEHCKNQSVVLPRSMLFAALRSATAGLSLDSGGAGEEAIRKALMQHQSGVDVDFDEFVGLADQCRAVRVVATQKMAGFSELEIKHLQELFGKYDKDRSGDISVNEIQVLLSDLGMECRTLDERRAVQARLDEARTAAREAMGEGAGNAGGGNAVGFWEVVQLIRLLRNENDRAEDHKMELLRESLGFSAKEVNDFREVFLTTARDSSRCTPVSAGNTVTPAINASLSFFSSAPTVGGTTEDGLSPESFCLLLRSLGVERLSSAQKQELQRRTAQCDKNKDGHLNFTGFLRMMRWLLDSDFAGINGKTSAWRPIE